MKIYTLHKKQNLPISVDEAWDFLSNPRNLKTITPDYMGFHILSGADRPMFPGQIIQYIVTPVLGIKTKWVTEITHVKDKEYFVDENKKCMNYKMKQFHNMLGYPNKSCMQHDVQKLTI